MSATPIVISERRADYRDTDRSTQQTIQAMCEHIKDAVSDPEVQRIAELAAAGGGRREIAAAVWAWLKNNIQFVTDDQLLLETSGRRDELELLVSPSVMVRMQRPRGDCDCFVMTGCSLLICLGVPCVIETLKCQRDEPWRWSHVCFGAVLEDGSVFPMDASHGDYPGWHVPAHDIFDSQYWDMNGNKVGGSAMRGFTGYSPAPNWTGNELTTVRGRHAGPYAVRDFSRVYFPGTSQRLDGLQGISRGRFTGLGACVGGFDEFDVACTDFTPITNDPAATQNALNYLNTPSSSSGSFNFGNFLGTLLGDAASLTSKALSPGAQVLPNGNILLPSGQIVAGSPTGTIGGISTTTILIGGGILFALLLVMGKK